MDFQVEETSPTQRKVSVTVPANDVDEAFNKVYRQIGRTARVPGFRPGKVPRGLLDVHYGAQVRSEVQNELVNTSLPKAMMESKISPIGMPEITPGLLKKGNDFSYSVEIEIQPEIELKQYKHLVVEPIAVEITEEEIEGDLDSLRQQSAQLVPVMLRDVVEEGDIVQMDYEAFIGGMPVAGSKAENAMIEVGGEGYLPGFSDGLIGARVPSERDLPLDFPEDYTVKELAGKQTTFRVKIKELKTKELPALDDEFAKDLGAESIEALKERVRGTLEVRKKREIDQEQRRRVLKALVDANPCDLPPSLVRAQADSMIAGAASRVQQLMGQKLQLSDSDLASLREESQGDAEFQVRSAMLMLEVAKKEGLEISDVELDEEIDRMAKRAGDDEQRLRASLADPEQRSQLRFRMLEDRTIEFLMAQSAENEEAAAKAMAEEMAKEEDEQATQREDLWAQEDKEAAQREALRAEDEQAGGEAFEREALRPEGVAEQSGEEAPAEAKTKTPEDEHPTTEGAGAEASETGAEASETSAEASETSAEAFETGAEASETSAEASETSAEAFETNAEKSPAADEAASDGSRSHTPLEKAGTKKETKAAPSPNMKTTKESSSTKKSSKKKTTKGKAGKKKT